MTAKGKRTRRSIARKHEVKASLANFELAKARSSLTLDIYATGEKIGALEIGRGSLYWQGRSKKRSKRIDWTRFAMMMDELAFPKKRTTGLDMMSMMTPVQALPKKPKRKVATSRR